jgi:hypothetical protein
MNEKTLSARKNEVGTPNDCFFVKVSHINERKAEAPHSKRVVGVSAEKKSPGSPPVRFCRCVVWVCQFSFGQSVGQPVNRFGVGSRAPKGMGFPSGAGKRGRRWRVVLCTRKGPSPSEGLPCGQSRRLAKWAGKSVPPLWPVGESRPYSLAGVGYRSRPKGRRRPFCQSAPRRSGDGQSRHLPKSALGPLGGQSG